MPNNSPLPVRNSDDLDPRIARTTQALGAALIDLIREKPFDAITVQQILERAGVGRTAFYSHYRNKEDVLASSYERLFAGLEAMLPPSAANARRLFPVREFIEHLQEAGDIVEALRRDGRLEEVWSLCTAHAARMIELRMGAGPAAALPRPMLARLLAGALVESIRWWLDHPGAATPEQVDAAFHRLPRG